MYKRGGLGQPFYCLRAPRWPFVDTLYMSPLPAGTIFVSEAVGEMLPEEGVFPPGSGASCWQAPAVASNSPGHLLVNQLSWTTPENTLPASYRGLISSKFYWCDTMTTCLPPGEMWLCRVLQGWTPRPWHWWEDFHERSVSTLRKGLGAWLLLLSLLCHTLGRSFISS